MNIVFTGRVIELYKGDNPKYPDTRVTIKEEGTQGQLKLDVPPSLASKFADDAKVTVTGVVVGRIASKIGLVLKLQDTAKVEVLK